MHTMPAFGRPATADEIHYIIGSRHQYLLDDICSIGPTLEEICEAHGCLEASAGSDRKINEFQNEKNLWPVEETTLA
jgi:hypothetical protein